jgi:hypothetical protein
MLVIAESNSACDTWSWLRITHPRLMREISIRDTAKGYR